MTARRRSRSCASAPGYATADIGRIGTQQDFLKSVASQMLTLGNIPNLPTFIDIFVNNVDTNLSAENIAFFARQFLQCKSEDIHFYTLPGNYGDSVKGLSYVSINIDEWLQMVNDYLNPYDKDVTEANVNILVHSYTSGFYSTTGYIAGGADSFYDNTPKTSTSTSTSTGSTDSGSTAPTPPAPRHGHRNNGHRLYRDRRLGHNVPRHHCHRPRAPARRTPP